jgi:acetylornithine deacetylase/succinyl-diaminopimelate desuccinylase-like protein
MTVAGAGRGRGSREGALHRAATAFVAPWARAPCQIRFTTTTNPAAIESVLRRHLDAHGFAEVRIEAGRIGMPASASSPDDPWIRWAADSMARSLGRKVQVIPAASGGMPGDVFQDLLGTPLVWVPHGHNGCQQHGPDEHMLVEVARQGISAFAGFWWDLGEGPFAGWSARRNPIKQDFATIRN